MRKLALLIMLLSLLVLGGCTGGGGGGPDTTPTANNGDAVTVTLLHYNDLHAHLTAHADRIPDAPIGQTAASTKIVTRGGMARLATLIQQQRQAYPNSILMNIGDTFHGGVEALFTLGNAIADPVNALGFDIGVPGNWDFAYGPNVTRLRYAELTAAERNALLASLRSINGMDDIKRPNYPHLAANVTYTAPPSKAGQAFLPATQIIERGGVRVGFIGLTSDIVPRMSNTLATGLAFMQGETNYKLLLEQHASNLRSQGADVVVVMSELGIHRDKRLADVLAPGTVHVFFSAHTHEATFTPLTSLSGALVVEAGNDGYLGRMNVTLTPGQLPVFNWSLLPIDSNVPEEPAMAALVNTARAPFLATDPNIKLPMPYVDLTLHQSIITVVGQTDGALDRRAALDNTFNRSFADGLRLRGGTQLAMTPGFRFDAVIGSPGELLEDNTIANGNITIEDVYRFFPVVYTLSNATVTGQRLKEILEEGLTSVYSPLAFNQGGGWLEGFSGLALTVNVAGNDNARLQSALLTDTQAAIDDAAVYSITGCTRPDDASDELCSYSGFSQVQAMINPATGSAWTVNEMFLDLLATRSLVTAASARITDNSATPVWPQAPFVQPLW